MNLQRLNERMAITLQIGFLLAIYGLTIWLIVMFPPLRYPLVGMLIPLVIGPLILGFLYWRGQQRADWKQLLLIANLMAYGALLVAVVQLEIQTIKLAGVTRMVEQLRQFHY